MLSIHKALSNNLRFLIYNLLKEDGLCTCALSVILDKPEGSLSHHIKILENAGLIIGQRKGRFTVYYTRENLIKQLT
ncbi:MAG: ArsR/SmtB family transcription factor [Promethearchaeota archaeon]